MDEASKIHQEFADSILQGMIDNAKQLRHLVLVEDWYGDRFLTTSSPYLWLIPLTVTVIILTVFKRAQLFGYTQKYLLAIMVLDLLYCVLNGIRDMILNLFDMEYGYIEYKLCRFFFLSFYMQNSLHGVSLWIKCMMSFTQCILIAFPLKCKSWKLKRFVITFAMFNLIFLSLFFALPVMMPLNGILTTKFSRKDYKISVIEACSIDFDTGFYYTYFFSIMQKFSMAFALGYCFAIPTVLDIVLISILVFLTLKHLKLYTAMALSSGQRSRIKYLILMKMNIILGVSFILQEVPIFTYLIIMLTSAYNSKLLQSIGIYNEILTLSFVIGKPLDLIIYASMSEAFRSEFRKFFLRGKKCLPCRILGYNINAGERQKNPRQLRNAVAYPEILKKGARPV